MLGYEDVVQLLRDKSANVEAETGWRGANNSAEQEDGVADTAEMKSLSKDLSAMRTSNYNRISQRNSLRAAADTLKYTGCEVRYSQTLEHYLVNRIEHGSIISMTAHGLENKRNS